MKDIDIDAAIALSRELGIEIGEGKLADLVEAIRKADVHLTSADAVDFNAEEAKALDHLKKYMEIVQGFGLHANGLEVTSALHVLQGFLVQHMLHRLNPDVWSDWYKG